MSILAVGDAQFQNRWLVSVTSPMRPIGFGKGLAAGIRSTLFSKDKREHFFTVIKLWTDKTSGIALTLKTGVPSYEVEDEEAEFHLTIE